MQYVNVTQFYQSILCFSIQLLVIQRIILFWFALSNKYEAYRTTFYQDQFKYLKQNQPPSLPDSTLKDTMIDNKSPVLNQSTPHQPISPANQKTPQSSSHDDQKKRNKTDFDLQRDLQLKNNPTSQHKNQPSKSMINQSNIPQSNKPKQQDHQQKISSSSNSKQQQQQQQTKKQPQIVKKNSNPPNPANEKPLATQQDIQAAPKIQQLYKTRQSVLMESSIHNKPQKIVIQLGHGELQQKGQKDQIKLRYARRVDDAFSFHIPIIMSIIILGILTNSVYIYSMCCFFGYAYATILFNFSILFNRIQGSQQNNSIFGKINTLISSFFILGLFISYWISDQFTLY